MTLLRFFRVGRRISLNLACPAGLALAKASPNSRTGTLLRATASSSGVSSVSFMIRRYLFFLGSQSSLCLPAVFAQHGRLRTAVVPDAIEEPGLIGEELLGPDA